MRGGVHIATHARSRVVYEEPLVEQPDLEPSFDSELLQGFGIRRDDSCGSRYFSGWRGFQLFH